MSETTDEPASARGLADILREAGISAAGAGGRRRRRDDAQAAAEEDNAAQPPQLDSIKAASASYTDGGPGTDLGGLSSYFRTRSEAHIRSPDFKAPDIADLLAPPRTDTGPLPTTGWSFPGTGWPETSSEAATTAAAGNRTTAGSRTTAGDTSTSRGGTPAEAGKAAAGPAVIPDPETADTSGESISTPATSHSNRSASPVATTAPADPDEIDSAAPIRAGVASWAILAVELLSAVGLGIAAWYAFSAVWELLPYVAAFLGPLVVTGLVAVAGALRARTGRNPLGLPTLCILVFAGTVLVVLPAATVIIP